MTRPCCSCRSCRSCCSCCSCLAASWAEVEAGEGGPAMTAATSSSSSVSAAGGGRCSSAAMARRCENEVTGEGQGGRVLGVTPSLSGVAHLVRRVDNLDVAVAVTGVRLWRRRWRRAALAFARRGRVEGRGRRRRRLRLLLGEERLEAVFALRDGLDERGGLRADFADFLGHGVAAASGARLSTCA